MLPKNFCKVSDYGHSRKKQAAPTSGSVWVSTDYRGNALRKFVQGCNAARVDEVGLSEISDRQLECVDQVELKFRLQHSLSGTKTPGSNQGRARRKGQDRREKYKNQGIYILRYANAYKKEKKKPAKSSRTILHFFRQHSPQYSGCPTPFLLNSSLNPVMPQTPSRPYPNPLPKFLIFRQCCQRLVNFASRICMLFSRVSKVISTNYLFDVNYAYLNNGILS